MKTPFAAGWYLACLSRDLSPGGVLSVEIAGVPLVVFRTKAGVPSVLARFCPHLGASLALGRVVEETIQCPFHHWRFDGSGTCVKIPDCPKIPPAARARPYPSSESFQGVWVFLGAAEPFYDLPTEQALFGGEYFCARVEDMGLVNATCRDILENAVDMSHVAPVHHVKLPRYEIREWSMPRLVIEADIETIGGLMSTSRTELVGPGLWLNIVKGGLHKMPFCLFIFPTPVTATTTRLRCVVYIKGNKALPWDFALGWVYAWLAMRGPHQDMAAIWKDKIVHERPALAATDGPIMRFRHWYSDFDQRWTADQA